MKKKIIQINELEQCACFNARLMARELTNEYNETLKFTGLNSTQIPILAILNIYNQTETSKIATIFKLEISTIRRNLNILIKKDLVRIVKRGVDGNTLTLTNKGYEKLKKALPVWRSLQNKGKNRISKYLKVLEDIL